MDTLKKNWISESCEMWPGSTFSFEVKEVLHQAKSQYQEIQVFDTASLGKVLVLDGIIQCTQKDEFSFMAIDKMPRVIEENEEFLCPESELECDYDDEKPTESKVPECNLQYANDIKSESLLHSEQGLDNITKHSKDFSEDIKGKTNVKDIKISENEKQEKDSNVNIQDPIKSNNSESVEIVSDSTSRTIEESLMVMIGEGNGAECESYYFVGEEIEEPVMYIFGDGWGEENNTGNPDTEEQVDENKTTSEECNSQSHDLANINSKKIVKSIKLRSSLKPMNKRTLKKQFWLTKSKESKKHCIRDFDKSNGYNLNEQSDNRECSDENNDLKAESISSSISKRKMIKARKRKLKPKGISKKENDEGIDTRVIVKKQSRALKRTLFNANTSDKNIESQSESEEEEPKNSGKRLKVKPNKIIHNQSSSRKKVEAKHLIKSLSESEEETVKNLGGAKENDKPGQDELDNTCQTKQYIPHHLIGIMYQLDLSVLCSLRQSMYKNKYPFLSLAFGDSEIDKFNDIVLRNEKKSIHIKIENSDKYYVNNGISYARLFTKEKRSFSINNYFDSFVKYIISKLDSLSNNIEYLIVYTNLGFDLTKEKNLREGKFKNFYPFKFDSIKIEEFDLLKDFLYVNSNTQESGFYRFSQDKTTKEELLKRLEFSTAIHEVIKERKISQDFEKEIKEAFLDKLVFVVNQPDREELNSIIKNEIQKNSTVEDDYIALQERVLHDLTAPEKNKKPEIYVSRILHEFNLLMLFLNDMFLYKNIFSINYEGKPHDISNNIALDYRDKIIYVKAYQTNVNIGYSQLFPLRHSAFSINRYFTLFAEELKENIDHFIIYTNANLDLTDEKKLKEGRSKDFYPLKFDNDNTLRDFLCINGNGLYRFVQEEDTRKKLLSLLKLPPSLQKEKEEKRLTSKNEQEIKGKFLDKLIFAINQPNREKLNNIVKDEIDRFDVPYNYEELHEIALRWSESHEFGPLTKGIMEKLLGDVKNNKSSYKKIQNKNINEEIKFARSVVGREGIPAFNQFLNFLITGEGIKCLKVLKREGIDLASMSSILHVAGAKAAKVFKDLYDIWFNEQGNKTQYLKTLEKEGINLSNMSSILGGAGSNAARAFKDLHGLWFNVKGSKSQYLKTLEKEGIDLARMSSILSGAGANAAKAFKDLYDIWFNERGKKTQYLKTLEKEGVNLSNVSSILNVAGVNAAKVFKDLYDLWFNVEGNKTQYLKTLEKEGIDLARMSSILSGAGANAAKVLKDLYDIWFDGEGSKTQYLKTLEKEGIDLARMSSILSGAGVNGAKAFKDLYDIWFDAKGNKVQYLKHFIEDKGGKKSFTLHNLSGILSRAGAYAKDAFEKFHNVCFSENGKRTELLDDFYKAGFTPSNLSSTLCGAGTRASFILKRFHSTCFNEKREKTKYLDDFCKAGFKPRDLCGVLSSAANSLKKFHDFCFTKETKKYLNHFLIEKGERNFIPKNLSKILHGAGANICSAVKDFHDVCFDETGNKTQLLDDFYEANFRPGDLSNILSMAGNNAASILKNFHKSCFNKENYLDCFIAGKKLFTPKDLSKILYGVGINIGPIFKKLHYLCFDKVGNITKYLNNLIKNNPPNKILNILYEEIRKSSVFLDEQNVSEGDRATSACLKPSSSPGNTKQKHDIDGLKDDSEAKRKPRKGNTNRSKNGKNDFKTEKMS